MAGPHALLELRSLADPDEPRKEGCKKHSSPVATCSIGPGQRELTQTATCRAPSSHAQPAQPVHGECARPEQPAGLAKAAHAPAGLDSMYVWRVCAEAADAMPEPVSWGG